MREIPILFSTEMVQAILAGRKTVTRRIVKGGFDPNEYQQVKKLTHAERADVGTQAFFFNEGDKDCWGIKVPYCKGDVLYVRETFIDLTEGCCAEDVEDGTLKRFSYRADNEPGADTFTGWKPSIHMPKDAARIWLKVEAVEVQRLQDISEEDAKAEGVLLHEGGKKWLDYGVQKSRLSQFIYCLHTAKLSFRSLWDTIAEYPATWRDNPWVWVVRFKVLSTTVKPDNLN